MKFAVIDDERPSRSELCHLIQEIAPSAQVDEADSASGAIELVTQNRYTAIFLDIHLGDMQGTDLCAVLKRMQPDIKIIFATAYDKYAIQAFDMNAFDYILKPFDPARVRRAIEKAAPEQMSSATAAALQNKLSIVTEKRVVVIDISELAFIETDSRNCVLHTGSGKYTSSQPLSHFEKKLCGSGFFRVHKSYLVNLSYVTELSPWFNGMYCAKLRGFEKENVPVSRKQVKIVKDLFEI